MSGFSIYKHGTSLETAQMERWLIRVGTGLQLTVVRGFKALNEKSCNDKNPDSDFSKTCGLILEARALAVK